MPKPKGNKSSSQATPSFEPRQLHETYRTGQTLPAEWSPDVYAGWFFDFLRTDLATLTPGQLLGMRADAGAFGVPGPIVKDTSEMLDEGLPTVAALDAVQRDSRAGIQRVLDGDWFYLEHGIPYGIARQGNYIVREYRDCTFRDRFVAAALDVIQTCWSRLRLCPRCHAIFLKTGKQKYCSPTCASRAHWDAFKARRGVRDHHGEYKRRAQKRLGPNVKVKPRRRT